MTAARAETRRHIKNVFAEGELERSSVVAESATTAADGKTYQVEFYNLEMIIAVGYRVKSPRGTQFRQWATARIKEYLVKGFVMDDERLKNPPGKGHTDYFDELLERIRDRRNSRRSCACSITTPSRVPWPNWEDPMRSDASFPDSKSTSINQRRDAPFERHRLGFSPRASTHSLRQSCHERPRSIVPTSISPQQR